MAQKSLSEILAVLVERCLATEEGRRTLAMYDHAVQFTPLDGDPFYLEARRGKAGVQVGVMGERPITAAHEIKADSEVFRQWLNGRERMSDLIEDGRMFPVASHTTKRHIDHWLARIVRLGNGQKAPQEVY